MKLGFFLLILGVILAAVGITLLSGASPATAELYVHSNYISATAQAAKAAGAGLLVLGGGLTLIAVLRIVLKW